MSDKKIEILEEYDRKKIIKYSLAGFISLAMSIYLFYPLNKDLEIDGFSNSLTPNLELISTTGGKITAVNVNEGDIVSSNQLLMSFFNKKSNKDLEDAWFLLWDTQTEMAKLKAFLTGESEINYSKVEGNDSNPILNSLKKQKNQELTQLYIDKKEQKEKLRELYEVRYSELQELNRLIRDRKIDAGEFNEYTKERLKDFEIGSKEKKDFAASAYQSKRDIRESIKDLMLQKSALDDELKDLNFKIKNFDKDLHEEKSKLYEKQTTNEFIIKSKIADIISIIKEEKIESPINGKIAKINSVVGDFVENGTNLFNITPENRIFEILTFLPKETYEHIKDGSPVLVKFNTCKTCEVSGTVNKKLFYKTRKKEENSDTNLEPLTIEVIDNRYEQFKDEQWNLTSKENVKIIIKQESKSRFSSFLGL